MTVTEELSEVCEWNNNLLLLTLLIIYSWTAFDVDDVVTTLTILGLKDNLNKTDITLWSFFAHSDWQYTVYEAVRSEERVNLIDSQRNVNESFDRHLNCYY